MNLGDPRRHVADIGGLSVLFVMAIEHEYGPQLKARIDREGLWLEQLETNPGRFIPERFRQTGSNGAVTINLDQPMRAILAELDKHPVRTRLSLTGTLVVAPDVRQDFLQLVDVERGRLHERPDGFAKPCGIGEVGMLLTRLRGVVTTSDSPLRGLFEPDDAWLATGDLFRADEDGEEQVDRCIPRDNVPAEVHHIRGARDKIIDEGTLKLFPVAASDDRFGAGHSDRRWSRSL